MKELWNKRYKADEYVYGKFPNSFFKENLDKITTPKRILFPAEGEGRNAVYAAKMGHDVTAFDISAEGKNKALELAKEQKVSINYLVGELIELNLEPESFDLAVLISAHFPPGIRSALHREIGKLINPGGIVILEGFSVNNMKYREQNPGIGGPDKEEMLFTKEIITNDFEGFKEILLEEHVIQLKEGILHNGTAKVIRFLGRK